MNNNKRNAPGYPCSGREFIESPLHWEELNRLLTRIVSSYAKSGVDLDEIESRAMLAMSKVDSINDANHAFKRFRMIVKNECRTALQVVRRRAKREVPLEPSYEEGHYDRDNAEVSPVTYEDKYASRRFQQNKRDAELTVRLQELVQSCRRRLKDGHQTKSIELFDALYRCILRNGRVPTQAELAAELGVKQPAVCKRRSELRRFLRNEGGKAVDRQ